RYVYGPDWEVKPGKLVSKKGTWLKSSTHFSWELPEASGKSQKLYLPQGVSMPVVQIGKVTDSDELKRHEWVNQHLRVWMKPAIIRAVEARRGTWFVYWPHFEDNGLTIIATVDTWLKRSTQMSGELQPFELIYVPRGNGWPPLFVQVLKSSNPAQCQSLFGGRGLGEPSPSACACAQKDRACIPAAHDEAGPV
ncbi:unnamed protein product, partial [Polarella glacialis]